MSADSKIAAFRGHDVSENHATFFDDSSNLSLTKPVKTGRSNNCPSNDKPVANNNISISLQQKIYYSFP